MLDGWLPARPGRGLDAPGAPWRPAWRQAGGGWSVLFTVTLFVSSALLFLVQPMFAKMVLPLLGGTPATWITSLLFFQAALLAGYAYAHWSTRWLGPRQPLVHVVLVALAVAVLPIAVPEGWVPPPSENPVGWLLALLVVAVGLPFFVVSSTTPLLQRWFAGARHAASDDPYFLYRASNLGSMVGLLGYPVLVEPRLRLADQGRLWGAGYLVLAVLTAGCAVVSGRRREAPNQAPSVAPDAGSGADAPARQPDIRQRAQWVALAFVPSSFMLAVTTYITTDIAAIPLLWVIPLTLYLVSFIVAFSPRPSPLTGVAVQLQPFLLLQLVLLVALGATEPVVVLVAVSLAALFVSALVCHGRLAEGRPPSAGLTEFYLWIALGGALGGVFNAVVAPVLFDTVIEYRLAIVAACLLRPPPRPSVKASARRRLDVVLPLGLLVATLALVSLGRALGLGPLAARVVAVVVALLACAAFAARRVRLGLGVAAVFVAAAATAGGGDATLHADRTFFGALRVERDPDRHLHRLVHGTTTHGAQSTEPGRRLELLTYYHRTGPVGQVFGELAGPGAATDVGVIGLGTGSMACYSRPGERWTFFELDPTVERIARDPSLFTYLRDCEGRLDVVRGDARLSLRRAPDRRLGLLVVDAFNSDAIPVHLLTRQALELYGSKLAPGGVLAFNVSNRYLDLEPVLGELARARGLACLGQEEGPEEARGVPFKLGSHWLAMARRPADLGRLPHDRRWRTCARDPGARPWTDDYSNLLAAL